VINTTQIEHTNSKRENYGMYFVSFINIKEKDIMCSLDIGDITID
jgi:hypothetical protein